MQYPKLIESRTSGIEVRFIEWNPTMDLLATVFTNGLLTCSRLLSFQKKVWHKQSNGKIISIAWRPDGRVLAVGSYNKKTNENVCTIHDVENGDEINSIRKEHAITSVSWFQYNQEAQHDSSVQSDDEAKKFSHQLAREQTRLNLLIISTNDGKISFYSLGLFCLGEVQITDTDLIRISIDTTHISSCFNFLTTVTRQGPDNGTDVVSLKMMRLETLRDRSNEILRISKSYAWIIDELEYLDDTINAISTSWADVLAGLDNKLSSYCSRKNKTDISKCGYTLLSADELLQLLVVGFPSDNLEKFLVDMSDKGLKKLNNAIEQTCLRVQNLNVKNAQKCCYHLHADLNLLRNMALGQERFQDVGLDDRLIIDAMRSVGSLLLKLTELQQVTDHSLKSTKSFFRWLISIACRITGEQNNSVIPNDINKTTQQDIQLITSFINENFDLSSSQNELDSSSTIEEDEGNERPTCSNFTLEQVGQYLKNEPLSRLKYSFMKPEANFWIEFCNQRPDLTEPDRLNSDGTPVLLFYPHSPNTSLIQEHKKTCNSIENAFKSVAANIDLVNSDTFVDLKQFVQNVPIKRIRVETDLELSRHYTLFPLSKGPVSKQYLIVQYLNDKTYKSVGIKFKEDIRGTNKREFDAKTFFICDSCFYENKESKKMLMCFLLKDLGQDDSGGITTLVQVEIDKVMESRCKSRGIDQLFDIPSFRLKDLNRNARSNDSIRRTNFTVVIKLDINTLPAHERQHSLDAMVKRVKGVSGEDMYASSGRGVIAFTSLERRRLHLYEFENVSGTEIVDDELEIDEKIDDSFIYTDMAG